MIKNGQNEIRKRYVKWIRRDRGRKGGKEMEEKEKIKKTWRHEELFKQKFFIKHFPSIYN